MTEFLNAYDLNRRKTAVLQNAFNVTERQELNGIYSLSFSLPTEDEKNAYCAPRCYVRWGDAGQLYRIMKVKTSDSDAGVVTYECEHVISTLCDTLLFGSYTLGGSSYTTAQAIAWVLSKQPSGAKHWTLGSCALSGQYEYGWEQENLLNALYSIPKPFTQKYRWDFDTSVYPWRVSLLAIDETAHPEYYIRAKHNLLTENTSQDYTEVCTRLYPLGYGEGVNQLNIKSVNNGKAYLQAPASVIAQYGIVDRVLVDKSFESADSLKAYGQKMLDALSVPSVSRTFSAVDLYPITGEEINNAKVGKICKLTGDGTVCYITATERIHDTAGSLQIELSTKTSTAADTIADLADRMRIESVYAQGATQLYQHSKDANASSTQGMILSLYFPSEMKQINKVLLRVKMGKFRASAKLSTEGATAGGTIVGTTAGGTIVGTTAGGTVEKGKASVSASGGGTVTGTINTFTPGSNVSVDNLSWDSEVPASTLTQIIYTEEGVEKTITEGYSVNTEDCVPTPMDGSKHMHGIKSVPAHHHSINLPTLNIQKKELKHGHSITASNLSHKHSFSLSASAPSVSDSGHSHTFTGKSHSHTFTGKSHSHTFTGKSHSHTITPGIFTTGSASTFSIYVAGVKKATVSGSSYNGDIVDWLLKNGSIPRNTWIDVELRPNDLAYFTTSVFVQGFVQSRGGGNY